MEGVNWNLWHGCHKYSEGCKNCYVYMGDNKRGIDSSKVYKTQKFYAPIEKLKNGEYKIKSESMVWTCFSSDFLLADADEWREEAWSMIRQRTDLNFLFITKRIERFEAVAPKDWHDGWNNVIVCCTIECQRTADTRLPIFNKLPIKHKVIICEPLLEQIDILNYLNDSIEEVVAGGESGYDARICNYNWILDLKQQCEQKNVTFKFKQTGAKFVKNNKLYFIERKKQHSQARAAGINYCGLHESYLK